MLVNLKLRPAYAGLVYLYEAAMNPPLMSAHCHVELELNLVMQGSITYMVAGHRHTFERGTLLWLFSTQEHQLIGRSPDAKHYVAVFKPALIKQAGCQGDYVARRAAAPAGAVFSRLLDPAACSLLARVMDTLLAGGAEASVLNRELGFGMDSDFRYHHNDSATLNAGLGYLLAIAWRQSRFPGPAAQPIALHASVRKAMLLLAEEGDGRDLGELARQCGISGPHLSRLFSSQVGMPLNRYRNSVRLSRFFQLHREHRGAKTMLAAALESGFGSYAQFHKVFRDTYGHGPAHYLHAVNSGLN